MSILPKFIVRRATKWRERKHFATKLEGTHVPQPLAIALARTASDSPTSEEQTALPRIEEHRSAFQSDWTRIEIHDYGAGNPAANRSQTEMDKGVITHRQVADVCKTSSKPEIWCRFLFHLIRQFKPERCLEMGTCLGISGAYIASAQSLNGAGRLVTLEGSPELAALARTTFEQLGLDNVEVRIGRFVDTLPLVLEELQPIDFVFVDGHHEERATCSYFDTIRGHLAPRGLMVFDDIEWSDGMRAAWGYVSSQGEAYDLGAVGVWISADLGR